jgi:hypothetical protein
VNAVTNAGSIKVADIKGLGENYVENGKNKPTNITVEIDPTPDNPAHAEIPQKLSRTLAFNIIKKLQIHSAPSVNE